MSWGEVEKINSWAKKGVPLNHLIWLDDYKTYGQKSYVYKDKDILYELYRSPICANDEDIQMEAFDYVSAEMQAYLGLWLSRAYSLRGLDTSSLQNCKSISDIIGNAECIGLVSMSEFSDAFFNLSSVVEHFSTTEGLKNASSNNELMNILESSDAFKTAVASNSDIQTTTKSLANGGSSITVVENAYIISASAGVGTNGSYGARGSVRCVPNGSTDEVTIISAATNYQHSGTTLITASVNQFVKSVTFGCPAAYGPLNNSVTYIQLDNVV